MAVSMLKILAATEVSFLGLRKNTKFRLPDVQLKIEATISLWLKGVLSIVILRCAH